MPITRSSRRRRPRRGPPVSPLRSAKKTMARNAVRLLPSARRGYRPATGSETDLESRSGIGLDAAEPAASARGAQSPPMTRLAALASRSAEHGLGQGHEEVARPQVGTSMVRSGRRGGRGCAGAPVGQLGGDEGPAPLVAVGVGRHAEDREARHLVHRPVPQVGLGAEQLVSRRSDAGHAHIGVEIAHLSRRRRESNPCTRLCRPLPKPLGHAAEGGSPYPPSVGRPEPLPSHGGLAHQTFV